MRGREEVGRIGREDSLSRPLPLYGCLLPKRPLKYHHFCIMHSPLQHYTVEFLYPGHLETDKSVLIRGTDSFHGVYEEDSQYSSCYLGYIQVSLIQRCPNFRSWKRGSTVVKCSKSFLNEVLATDPSLTLR